MKIIYLLEKKREKQQNLIGEFVGIESFSTEIEFSFSVVNNSGLEIVFDNATDEKAFKRSVSAESDCIIAPMSIIHSHKYKEISNHVSSIVPNLIKKYLENNKTKPST